MRLSLRAICLAFFVFLLQEKKRLNQVKRKQNYLKNSNFRQVLSFDQDHGTVVSALADFRDRRNSSTQKIFITFLCSWNKIYRDDHFT
jgi:hypothetical protein